ncbi:MAG TPA: hypothetical protein VJA21_06430 [Verrucomicrobiae bacterium]
MVPNTPSAPAPLSAPSTPLPPPKKTRWLLYGCGTLIALLLLMVVTVFVTIWWIQRPIKPVVLSASEKATVDQKIQRLSGGADAAPSPAASSGSVSTLEMPATSVPNSTATAHTTAKSDQDRTYVPGSKTFKLTEREINGLLNANTDLGKSVRLEFASDAINAYLVVPIPQDFPIGGGKMFRARGRFRLSLGNGGAPYAILEDVTVFGLSLPKAWLAGLKGENLLGQAVGDRNGSPVLRGLKSLRIEPGALVLEVED